MLEYFTRQELLQAAAVIYSSGEFTPQAAVHRAFELAQKINNHVKDVGLPLQPGH
jgi:hypothetical protein